MVFFFFQAEDGIRDADVTGVQTCALPIYPEDRVQAVSYCGDTYRVTTTDGKTRDFWERNLRFKTDSGEEGPAKGAPALVDAGMMGDRADVIFSGPEEINHFVSNQC